MGDIYYRPAEIELVSVDVVYTNITPSLPGYGICGFHETGYVALAVNSSTNDYHFTAYTWGGKYLDSFVLKDVSNVTQITATYKDGVFYGTVEGVVTSSTYSGFDFQNNLIINDGAGFQQLFLLVGDSYACASIYQGSPCIFFNVFGTTNPTSTPAVNYLSQSDFTLGGAFSLYATSNTSFEVNYATNKKSANQSETNTLAIGDVSVGYNNIYVGTTAYAFNEAPAFTTFINNGKLLITSYIANTNSSQVTFPMSIYSTGVVVDLIYRPMEYFTNFARNYSMPVLVQGAEHISSLPRNTNITFHL